MVEPMSWHVVLSERGCSVPRTELSISIRIDMTAEFAGSQSDPSLTEHTCILRLPYFHDMHEVLIGHPDYGHVGKEVTPVPSGQGWAVFVSCKVEIFPELPTI
jgi:hypothetical protein